MKSNSNSPTAPALPLPLQLLGQMPGLRWWATVVLLLGVVGLGIAGYIQQRLHGDIVTGMRSIGKGGVAWGLYIIFDIAFVGVAFAGILVACIARIFRLRELRPYARIAGLMSACALSMAGLCVIADLGRPIVGLMNLPKYARTMSPFFGTFTMVVVTGLAAIVVLMFLAGRADARLCAEHLPRRAFLYRLLATGYQDTIRERNRHRIISRVLSLVILPLMVLAYSTLGFVFGIQSGRPGWFSALQAPSFMVLAAISGVGLLLFISGVSARLLNLSEELPLRAFRWLTNTLWVLLVVFIYFTAVEELTARYAATSAQSGLARELSSGVYSPLFWTCNGLFLLSFLALFAQYLRGQVSVGMVMAIGLVVNVAAVMKRFLIVVPSQTHGTLMPYNKGHYHPTWVEFSVAGGLIALGTLLFLGATRVFPLTPLKEIEPVELEHQSVTRPLRRIVRVSASVACLLIGATLSTLGFLWSARWGTLPSADPVVPYSPVLFIIGNSMCLASAVLFELFPRPLPPRAPLAPEQFGVEAPSEPRAAGAPV